MNKIKHESTTQYQTALNPINWVNAVYTKPLAAICTKQTIETPIFSLIPNERFIKAILIHNHYLIL